MIKGSVLKTFDETFDGATDNLLSRRRNNNPQESFGYDNLDRLVSVKSGAAETMKISYAPNGNILFKTGVGSFSYDKNVRPHAVTEVENTDGKIPGDALITSYNDFGKIQLIEDAGKNLRMDFAYGPDQQRWYSELSKNGMDLRTTVYAGEYEKITENGITREFYYLDGNTIAIKENGSVKTYLAFTDNLGSILSVMDENGQKVFDASYDAWGKQTVALNTIGLHRGYTGHEMLCEFDIINMNGRLYDPVLGRFFSPDNYVQMPDNSQNFNLESRLGLFHEFSKLQNRTVQFGNNPNRVYHTFRHVDDMGLNRNMVRSSVINDLKRISNIPVGKPVNRIINVSGDKLQYTTGLAVSTCNGILMSSVSAIILATFL